MMSKRTTIILLVVSIVLSISALCVSLLRCEPITADWMGVLVGILSFAVTILLGWQIYALFDIREIQKEVKRNKAEVDLKAERSLAEAHYALCLFHEGNIDGLFEDKSIVLASYIQSCAAAMFHFSSCGEYRIVQIICCKATDVLNSSMVVKLNPKIVSSVLEVLMNLQNPNKVPGYAELLSALHKRL